MAPLCAAAQSHAALSDPTRPPPEALQLQSPSAVPAPSVPRKPVLQSVLVGKGHEGREVAVIDGEVVRKGQAFHGAVLEEVGANVAVLRRGNKTETLILFPLAAGSRKK
ncbi:MSHA biogenesis protein MshK [Pseudoduganella eburnea]|uniref:MSHA biogenesis protein MshK n=1 Tax=Massilia eburnea TaxID=1776165 RepID=A0A6L6QNH0_9BURK|nr:MSHA biogenesis protein MshK [Massilia eburnea]